MDLNDIRSVVTLCGLAIFVGLVVWNWRPSRRAAHDHAAQLVFEGDAHGDEQDAPR